MMPGPSDIADSVVDHGPLEAVEPRPPARRRLAAIGEMAVCSGFPTQIVLAILFRTAGLPEVTSDGQISLPFVAVVSLADTALLVGLMLWFLQASGQTGAQLWLGTRPLLPEIVRGVLLTPLILASVGLLLLAIQAVGAAAAHRAGEPAGGAGAQGPDASGHPGRRCGRRRRHPRGVAARVPGRPLRAPRRAGRGWAWWC